MKRLLKNKKALSPVVAAIILIAVTVAVSIAVAAWMGSLTIDLMETSELTVTRMAFTPADNNITIYITNSGTSDVTIGMTKVNGNTMPMGTGQNVTRTNLGGATAADYTFAAGETGAISIDYNSVAEGFAVTDGNKYSVNFFKSDGTLVGSFQDTA
jgi:flagellin-like protein